MSKDLTIKLTDKEYEAIDAIRGLPQDAHFLVMTADRTDSGWTLEGESEAYKQLGNTIWEELEEGFAPKKYRSSYTRILKLLDMHP